MSWTITEQSQTGEVQYMIGQYTNGLVTTANALRGSITTSINSAGNSLTITGISPSSTSGSGTGAIFTLITSGLGVISPTAGTVTVTTTGSGFFPGDTITFIQADLVASGFLGTTSGDLVITLQPDDITPLSNATVTASLPISGYSIDVSFVAASGLAPGANLEGSLDGTHFFIVSTINTVTSNPPVNDIRCEIPVKFIRLQNISGGDFTNITFSAEA